MQNAAICPGREALAREARKFACGLRERRMTAARRLALRFNGGIDLEELDVLDAQALRRLDARMTRRLERERLKGVHGHWSYDLNRHIALKAALDDIRARLGRVS